MCELAEKCILVTYSNKQKGYKCYNPWTKEFRVSQDVVFDESALWYQPPTNLIPITTMPNSEDKSREAIEEEIGTQEEGPISFWLSGLIEELGKNDRLIE